MGIEISKTDRYYQIIIPISESYHDKSVRNFLDYLRLKAISAKSHASEGDIENLSEEVMQKWWNKNKAGFSE